MVPASIIWSKGTLAWKSNTFNIDLVQLEQLEEKKKEERVDDQLRRSSFTDKTGFPKILVLGDSHSGDIAAAVKLNLNVEKYELARLGFDDLCFSSHHRRHWLLQLVGTETGCEAQIKALKSSELLKTATHIVIANWWTEESLGGFEEGLALLRSLSSAKIILAGQNAVFPTFDVSLRYLESSQLQRLNAQLFDRQSMADLRINDELRKIALTDALDFIDRQSLVCPPAASVCQVVAADDKLLYTDRSHWSHEGRKLFGEMMVKKYGGLFLLPEKQ
jgi:hypothetical protein